VASVGPVTDEARAAWAAEVETHRVIRGRRWRVSDPRIPEPLRQALVDELMASRRAVRDAADRSEERAARDRVHDAKVALGERGLPWWEAEVDDALLDDRIRRTWRALGRTPDGASAGSVADVTSTDAERAAQSASEPP
jgi:hypothetical protein